MDQTLQEIITILHTNIVVNIVLILVEHTRPEVYWLYIVEAFHTNANAKVTEQP